MAAPDQDHFLTKFLHKKNIKKLQRWKISLKDMVNVMKGVLVKCDQAMKQFLLHLDETVKLGRKFIIQDLDENHLFISADILDVLQMKIDDLMDQISFPVTEKN